MRFVYDAIHPLAAVTGNVTTETTDARHLYMWVIRFEWTGTVLGTVKVQYSLDGTTFQDVEGSSQSTAGAAGSHTAMFDPNTFPYTRGTYTHTSGAGNLRVLYGGKGG